MLMKYMADEGRKRNIAGPLRKPSEDEVNKYYSKMWGFVLSLSSNPRSESFTWQKHTTCVGQKNKNKRSNVTSNLFY